ncbi:hypothetical protein [Antarcticirhabdus aurantiaca]|uniref:Uncharacterized protein n=1 Tax=Antarcticirhabdus aurantiaca TaxID=2606717 RepID=A0ACD4NUP7_9HYPH|nr:hypothetical protein [Antarcticirhabdus aurantiaca]WAJ30527.1 hypothetical protein OXU80_10110 [Jeongeuplla avenae]
MSNTIHQRASLPMTGSEVGSASAAQAPTGVFGAHTVQQAPQAQAPAPASGIGHKIQAFFKPLTDLFGKFGDQLKALFKPAAAANAPAQPAAQAAAPAAAAALPLKRQAHGIFNSDGLPFDVNKASVSERNAATYAIVKNTADGMTADSIGAFLRGANPMSNGANLTGAAWGAEVAGRALAHLPNTPLAISPRAHGLDVNSGEPMDSTFKALRDGPVDHDALADQAVDVMKGAWASIFGAPGDAASIATAAQRVPTELRAALATAWQAIDDSAADPQLKTAMKEHAARDILLLRTVNAHVGAKPAPVEGTKEEIDAFRAAEKESTPYQNRVELSAALQRLGNGRDFEAKSGHPSLTARTQGFGQTYGAALQEFARAVVDGADAWDVLAAKGGGRQMIADFEAIRTDWNTKIDNGIDPRQPA